MSEQPKPAAEDYRKAIAKIEESPYFYLHGRDAKNFRQWLHRKARRLAAERAANSGSIAGQ